MKNRVSEYVEIIKNIPLFANLTEDELQKTLKDSQIKCCKKGEILFLKDQKVVNFSIVLNGLIKLCTTDADGEEAIIQIIDSEKPVTDLFSDFFSTNAKTMESSTILSLPSKKFRENVKNNLHLAVNLLDHLSSQNKASLDQIEQLKLGDAKQKLGKFLLKAAFEKADGNKEKEINLRFDKSAIASLLGMRSETLSRALKKIKSDGEIKIKKDKITLVREDSLCSYCNNDIATKCNHRGSSFCDQDEFN